MSIPCVIDKLGMFSPIGINVVYRVPILVDDDHLARGLKDLDRVADTADGIERRTEPH